MRDCARLTRLLAHPRPRAADAASERRWRRPGTRLSLLVGHHAVVVVRLRLTTSLRRRAAPFLHFEACYYAPIQLAIERGWERFEVG